jgi:hypothetical protein
MWPFCDRRAGRNLAQTGRHRGAGAAAADRHRPGLAGRERHSADHRQRRGGLDRAHLRRPGLRGHPLATGSAAELSSPGIAVKDEVAEGIAAFSATATDTAQNASACSAPISYTRIGLPVEPPVPPRCIVPRLAGKTLVAAKAALRRAGCSVGKVRKPHRRHGGRHRALVVRSSSPSTGASPVDGKVNLRLGPKHRKARG